MSKAVPISWAEYVQYDATGLAKLVADGQLSAQELAVQAAEAVELINPDINCVIEVFAATVADPHKDGMNTQGPFHGVPMMIKDLGSRMKGRQQEAGYAWMEQHVPEQDLSLIHISEPTRPY